VTHKAKEQQGAVKPKVGALVKLRAGMEDPDIPDDRIGLVIKIFEHQDAYRLLLSNGKELQFSSYWLTTLHNV
jgi:hypothetical protein